MRAVDELRPLTTGRLLALWRESREADDPLERVLLCNGRILAECCFFQGERVYEDETEALEGGRWKSCSGGWRTAAGSESAAPGRGGGRP